MPDTARAAELAWSPAAVRLAASDQVAIPLGAWLGDQAAIDGFIRRIVAFLNRLPTVVVHDSQFDDYGSGYASFVEIFLTWRDGSARLEEGGHLYVGGISVLISRLGPLAAITAPSERERHGQSGSRTVPTADSAVDCPVPGWEAASREIQQVLDDHGIALLSTDILRRHIEPNLHIATNFGEPPYVVFDAWFHWMD